MMDGCRQYLMPNASLRFEMEGRGLKMKKQTQFKLKVEADHIAYCERPVGSRLDIEQRWRSGKNLIVDWLLQTLENGRQL